MEKILSIVVPTYNMERLLPRCLDSFIISNDLMNKIEVLVVNDGSKDSSSEIAHKYAEEYPNTFNVIDKPNGNYGSCINAALKVATGKYFRICDADDNYKNANLEEYIKFLSTTNTDIVFSPYETYCEDKLASSFEVPGELCDHTWSIDELDWCNKELLKFRAMHCMATKTKVLKENNYVQTEGISYTDTQFSFYSLLYSNSCSFYNKIIYIYYLGRNGQTMSVSSMRKAQYHFYLNADRMLESYQHISHPLSINRQAVLFDCIFTESILFVNAFLGNYINIDKQAATVTSLIKKAQMSYNACPLEDNLIKYAKRYKLWKKYHIPNIVIFILARIWENCKNISK